MAPSARPTNLNPASASTANDDHSTCLVVAAGTSELTLLGELLEAVAGLRAADLEVEGTDSIAARTARVAAAAATRIINPSCLFS